MRRQIVLATVLAASTAVMGACSGTPENTTKPANNPPAVSTPAASPSTSPAGSPGVNGAPKANATPDTKKPENKTQTDLPVNKDAKPAVNNANHK